jgi:hypothetical protein
MHHEISAFLVLLETFRETWLTESSGKIREERGQALIASVNWMSVRGECGWVDVEQVFDGR